MPKELARVLETKEIFQVRYDLTPAIAFQATKLSSFVQNHKEPLFKALELLICKLALNVNVKHNIEPDQAYDIARAIYRKYYFYSVEEIALVLRMGEDGELIKKDKEKGLMGKIFDRLSKDLIMDWFEIYDEKHRLGIVENKISQQDRSYRQESDESSEIIGKLAGKLIEEIDKRQKDEEVKEENYERQKAQYFRNKPNPGSDQSNSEIQGGND